MGYIRAEDILPPDVLAMVQEYIDGEMLYVPKKRSDRNNWGSVSGMKEYYTTRNAMICAEAARGVSVRQLAEKYFLSEKSIQRIIRGNPSCCDELAITGDSYEP